MVPLSEGRVVFGNRDGRVYPFDEQLEFTFHIGTGFIPFHELARILATKHFIIILHKIGTIIMFSLNLRKEIQTYHIEDTGNFKAITDGCIYSENEILLSTFYLNSFALVVFNFDTNKTRIVAMGMEFPTILSCSWQNVCIIFNKTEMEIHHLNKQTWTMHKSQVTIRGRVDLNSFREGPMCITDYGSILLIAQEDSLIAEYSSSGEFLRHWVTLTDFGGPVSLAFRRPFLWVLFSTNENTSTLVKYKILPPNKW